MSGAIRILALDLSLTATGWAWRDDTGKKLAGTLKPKKMAGPERLAWVRDKVLDLLDESGATLVVIEGYSFGSKGRAVFNVGELGGVIRCALHDAGVEFVEVAPSTLKKYATGRGNAPKDEVLVAAVRRLGYGGADNNEADALWLLCAVSDALGGPLVEMPKVNRSALDVLGLCALEDVSF